MCQADPRLLVAALSSDDIDVLLVIIGILRSMTSSAENRSIADCTTVRLMDERLKRFIEAGGLASVIAVLAHGRRRQWMHAPRAVTKKAALLDAHLLRVGMTLRGHFLSVPSERLRCAPGYRARQAHSGCKGRGALFARHTSRQVACRWQRGICKASLRSRRSLSPQHDKRPCQEPASSNPDCAQLRRAELPTRGCAEG